MHWTHGKAHRGLTIVGGLLLAACTDPVDPGGGGIRQAPASPENARAVVALGTVTTAWTNDTGGVSIAVDAADNVYTAYWDYNPA
ncbi:MAG TPA: hypothetical protein VFV33_03360, partial [Gemmatimonadaceae bacterium]|nr:hypothetical protein [Gemmatimonadaceae bacterium]